jgi:hypothetical protein
MPLWQQLQYQTGALVLPEQQLRMLDGKTAEPVVVVVVERVHRWQACLCWGSWWMGTGHEGVEGWVGLAHERVGLADDALVVLGLGI